MNNHSKYCFNVTCIYAVILCIFVFLMAGCTTQQKLYSWGNFESQLYSYLKGENPGNQITVMERDRVRIEGEGRSVPPGFYAHLGLLYIQAGDDINALNCLQAEKLKFPESAPFINFLLRKVTGEI